MKKLLKNIGKFFFVLRQKNVKEFCLPVLLIDGGPVFTNNDFCLAIENVKKKFINAKLVVLTSKERRSHINNPDDIEIIILDEESSSESFALSIRLFILLLRRRFSFVVLPSLDISLVFISLLLARCPVILHNRWMEWYRLRERTVLDLVRKTKSADRKRGINIFKSLGRIFVVLSNLGEDIICRILIEDNGYADIGHVRTAIERAGKICINPDIALVTFEERKRYFLEILPDLKIFTAEETNNRYRIARQMFHMRKLGFDRVILTSLDISPILISALFMKTKVLLYNRWHQWWSIKVKGVADYLKAVFSLLIKIPVFIYLFVYTAFILAKTGLRSMGLNYYKER